MTPNDTPDWSAPVSPLASGASVLASGQVGVLAGTYLVGTIPGGSLLLGAALSGVVGNGTLTTFAGDAAINITDGTATVTNILDLFLSGGTAAGTVGNSGSISLAYPDGLLLKALDPTKVWTVNLVFFDDVNVGGRYYVGTSIIYYRA